MARIARPAFVLAWLATILASGAAVLAACGSFGVAEESPASEAGSEGAVREAGAALCEPGAFCDSFDDGKPLPRGWKAVATLGDASLTIVPDAGVGGSSALVATLVNDGKVQTALLPFDVGQKGPPAYDVVLAFSARVTTTDAGFVLGPRFFGDAPDGGSRDLIIDWHNGLIRMDRNVPSCDGGCLVSKKDTAVDTGWHRYTLTINVHSASASDYGRFKLELDTETLEDEALTFSLSNPSKYGLQFGVTYSSGGAGGTVAFDDVSLLVTPR